MDKNKWVYVGIGAFFLLVLFNSTKDVKLTPIQSPNIPDNKNIDDNTGLKNFDTGNNFDSSILPVFLKPPNRLNEGENLPKLNVPKRVLGFNMTPKKRFDI